MSVEAILSAIHREHAERVKAATEEYNSEVQPAIERLKKIQKAASDRQKAALAAADKWRTQAIRACCPGRNPTLSDIKKATRYVGEERKPVSVAHVSCLEGRA